MATAIAARPTARSATAAAATLVAVAAVAVGWVTSRWGSSFPLFWAFGLAFGIILQRSRFCFASAFRDLFLFGTSGTLKGILAGMAVATAGFALLESKMVPRTGLGMFPPEAHVFPLGWHLVVGGVVFGIGMVVAGGCVSGTLYRMGEGYLASYASFFGILVGLGLAAHSWNLWWDRSIAPGPMVWLPEYLGYAGAVAVTLLGLAAVWLVLVAREARAAALWPLPPAMTAAPAAGYGAVPPAGETAGGGWQVLVREVGRRLGPVVKEAWPATLGGALLGVLNVYLYTAHMPLGVTGELSRWALGLYRLAGVAPGPLKGADQLPGCTLALGGSSLLSHSLMLDVGLIVGSLLAALASGEFRWRRAPARRWVQSSAGGVLMGYGAGIAGGCTVGAFFSAIPSLGLNGWLFGLALLVGAGIGTQVVRRLP